MLALLFALLAVANAAPFAKRHSHCFSYSTEGCSYSTTGSKGAVATEVGTCSEVGVDILAQGGNAADAMVASALCVGVIGAYHSGIGGGGFMIVRYNNPDGTHGYETIDFRETMPAAGNETMYSMYGVDQTKSTVGGLAVGVPGELRGWETLHSRHGSLPWADLFAPAINIARTGFPVNVDLASFLSGRSWIANDTYFARTYAPNGTVLGLGDTVYRPDLADTLEKIAKGGADVFYKGELAQNIVNSAQAAGGIITLDDLANYTALVKKPGSISYRGKKLFSTVAPSSGTITLSALKIFSGFNGSAQDSDPAINLTTHRLVQATKLAYGQRATLGDPAFTSNVTTLEDAYLTDAVASAARKRILDNTTFPASYYNPSDYYPSRESGTSHLATADGSGMAVSLTTTVNLIWGSRVMTPDGIILNDEMDDFSSPGQTNAFGFAASPINFIRPGKRPQSSISSTLVEDEATGEFLFATGSAGGSRIITATMQELYHYIDQGLNASQCTRHPRWHEQLGTSTLFELPDASLGLAGYSNGTVAFFKSLGYNTTYQDTTGSTSHAIGRLPNGQLLAASDPRKAAGYGAAF